ncbi:hypothetical protein N7478_010841 [Penicillium angulare]|uniref:uncharacterized protein n=1 Tax=Penicillium angulare TaxID=116970 RepID=UPI00254073F6|nr:uncharacterized protein N7478_010841 [Penicillium angulare]KAJ5263236.1 hypothetical protein N7478_010841 [Penicillium angulare]
MNSTIFIIPATVRPDAGFTRAGAHFSLSLSFSLCEGSASFEDDEKENEKNEEKMFLIEHVRDEHFSSDLDGNPGYRASRARCQ